MKTVFDSCGAGSLLSCLEKNFNTTIKWNIPIIRWLKILPWLSNFFEFRPILFLDFLNNIFSINSIIISEWI